MERTKRTRYKIKEEPGKRTCIRCGDSYPDTAEYFYVYPLRNESKKRYMSHVCRTCRSGYQAEYQKSIWRRPH